MSGENALRKGENPAPPENPNGPESRCGSPNVSVICKVWLDFSDGRPELDSNDGDYAEPYSEPDNALCRACEHAFTVE